MIHLRTLICGVLACGAASGYANQTSENENTASQSRGSDASKVVAKKDSPSEVAAKYAHLDDAEEGAVAPETKHQSTEQLMHQKVQEQKAKPLSAPEKKAANQKAAEEKASQEQKAAKQQKAMEQKVQMNKEREQKAAAEQRAQQPPPAPAPKGSGPNDWIRGIRGAPPSP